MYEIPDLKGVLALATWCGRFGDGVVNKPGSGSTVFAKSPTTSSLECPQSNV